MWVSCVCVRELCVSKLSKLRASKFVCVRKLCVCVSESCM